MGHGVRRGRWTTGVAAAALALVAAGCGGGDAADDLAAEMCDAGERMFDVLEGSDAAEAEDEMVAIAADMQRIITDAEEQGVSEADLTARADEACPELEERSNELLDVGDLGGAGAADAGDEGDAATDEG